MNTTLNEVVVHLNENLDEPTLADIERGIRRDEGVVSVGHRAGQGHLMMVVYDSEITRAAGLLRHFQQRGLHAQLIGF